MNLTGAFPLLVGSDTLYTLKSYSETMADKLGGGTSWTSLALGTSWGTVSGYNLEARKFGKLVEVRGMARFATGAYTNAIATLPVGMRPMGQHVWANLCMGSVSKCRAYPFIQTNGVIQFPGGAYTDGTPVANDLFIIRATFHTDQV